MPFLSVEEHPKLVDMLGMSPESRTCTSRSKPGFILKSNGQWALVGLKNDKIQQLPTLTSRRRSAWKTSKLRLCRAARPGVATAAGQTRLLEIALWCRENLCRSLTKLGASLGSRCPVGFAPCASANMIFHCTLRYMSTFDQAPDKLLHTQSLIVKTSSP